MLILHIIVNLATGGAELMLKRLLSAHRDNPDFNHRVISLGGLGTVGPQLQAIGVEVETLGVETAFQIPGAFLRLISRIRAIKPDIVQTWMYHADLIGGLAARTAGIKHVIWGVRIAEMGPGMGVSPVTSWIRRACAALSRFIPARIIYVGHSARRTHEDIGYDSRKGIVIPNGYEIPSSKEERDAGSTLREELGLSGDMILIGSIGRFNPQKDHRSFVTAAGALAKLHPQLRFVMMGRGVDWDNSALASWIRDSRYEDSFYLLGERTDVTECLIALDILCLHSIGEGFPNVVAEAMSVGVACVVTDVGDAAFLVGGTGIVVPPQQPGSLAEDLGSLIDAGPDRRAELGRMARQRIMDHFSIEAISRRYEDLYVSLKSAAVRGRG